MVYKIRKGWPIKQLTKYPGELHIAPRTAYYVHDGKVVGHPLEVLLPEDVRPIDADFEKGVLPHER